MGYGTGETGDAIAAAPAGVARRDADLAAADRRLAEVVSEAHRIAGDAVRRIEAIRGEINAAVAGHAADTAAAARETARLLIAKEREIEAVVAEAAEEARAKAAVLQQLRDSYRVGS